VWNKSGISQQDEKKNILFGRREIWFSEQYTVQTPAELYGRASAELKKSFSVFVYEK
jgi:hypothetical protein